MFPDYEPTREYAVLELMRLQRLGRLDQVELADALQREHARGWHDRQAQLQIRLSWLPWGLRHAITRLVQSPSDDPPST